MIVSTKCLGVPEHIIDGETGFVSPHSDDKSLKLITKIVTN